MKQHIEALRKELAALPETRATHKAALLAQDLEHALAALAEESPVSAGVPPAAPSAPVPEGADVESGAEPRAPGDSPAPSESPAKKPAAKKKAAKA